MLDSYGCTQFRGCARAVFQRKKQLPHMCRNWYGTGTVDDRVTGSVPFSSWTVFALDWRKYLCTGNAIGTSAPFFDTGSIAHFRGSRLVGTWGMRAQQVAPLPHVAQGEMRDLRGQAGGGGGEMAAASASSASARATSWLQQQHFAHLRQRARPSMPSGSFWAAACSHQ